MTLEKIRFHLEAGIARAALALLRRLSPVAASNLGGVVARGIGPWLPVSRVADANLRLALPDLDGTERSRIIRGVWDNLGRTTAELPHLAALRRTASGPGWEIAGEEVARRIASHPGPVILITAHTGNWEMMTAMGPVFGVRMAIFYRAAANPLVDRLIVDLRSAVAGGEMLQFAKGAAGARSALGFLHQRGVLGILVDQKLNDGIPVPFFGHTAMTQSAAATLALRFGCPVLPAHVERLGPARLRIVFEEPIAMPSTGDRQADIAALTLQMNACVERWVRARPEQWLWLHRRWPKEETQ
jgi:KDO2-lipid IV(A) lauroyltransferase